MKKQIWIPIVAVVALAGVIFLSDREVTKEGGVQVLRTTDEYLASNQRAEKLSLEVFKKIDAGQELTDQDKQNLEGAVKEFEAMISYEPRRSAPNFGAGKAYMALGDFQRGAERFEQCVVNETLDPARDTPELKATVIEAKALASECLMELAASHAQSGVDELKARIPALYANAYGLADDAVRAQPQAPRYLLARANAGLQVKKKDQAKDDIKKALLLDPENPKAKVMASLVGLDK